MSSREKKLNVGPRRYSYYSRLDIFRGDNSIKPIRLLEFFRLDIFPPRHFSAKWRSGLMRWNGKIRILPLKVRGH